MLRTLGHLPEAPDPPPDDIPLPPELKAFLTDEMPRQTHDDRDRLTAILHQVKACLNRPLPLEAWRAPRRGCRFCRRATAFGNNDCGTIDLLT